MPVGEAVANVKEAAMDAVTIVVGAFIGRMVLRFVGDKVPMVAQYGPYAAILIGAVGAGYTSGLIRKGLMGVAVSGALGAIEMLTNQPAVIRQSK